MDLQEELRSLAVVHAEDVNVGQWIFESDRWAELIFCVLNACTDGDAPLSRQIASALGVAGMLDPSTLREASNHSSDENAVIRRVFANYGLTASESAYAVETLTRMGSAVTEHHDGRIQAYLRAKAKEIRDDLTAMFGMSKNENGQLEKGITLWLQNALNLPLTVDDKYVREFCTSRSISVDELQDAADAIDLNVAVVDDLIRVHVAAQAEAPARSDQ